MLCLPTFRSCWRHATAAACMQASASETFLATAPRRALHCALSWAAALAMLSLPWRSCWRRALTPDHAHSSTRQWALTRCTQGRAACLATDINPAAAAATRQTLTAHDARAEVVVTDLLAGLEARLAGRVDLLVFNPPYVPSPAHEARVCVRCAVRLAI